MGRYVQSSLKLSMWTMTDAVAAFSALRGYALSGTWYFGVLVFCLSSITSGVNLVRPLTHVSILCGNTDHLLFASTSGSIPSRRGGRECPHDRMRVRVDGEHDLQDHVSEISESSCDISLTISQWSVHVMSALVAASSKEQYTATVASRTGLIASDSLLILITWWKLRGCRTRDTELRGKSFAHILRRDGMGQRS